MSFAERKLAILILAAGQGTRMKSRTAKVLHPIAGRPMLDYPLSAAEALEPDRVVVVVGRDAEAVRQCFDGRAEFVLQEQQRGTGHAVLSARDALAGFSGDVLILYGDTPLLSSGTLRAMVERRRDTGADLMILTAEVDVPGIVVRDADGGVARVVEAPDATPDELAIVERNTGVYLLNSEWLWKTLSQVGDDNEQGEIYLTDIVELSIREGGRIEALELDDPDEAFGINTRAQLAEAAAVMRRRKLDQLMADGVSIVDPTATWVDVDVVVGRDTLIEPGCVIQGDSRIGDGVHLKPGCMIETGCEIADDVEMGPNAHLRPGTRLGKGVRIGNYVEVKNSVLGDGVKADHLTYIGDADIGAGASFGAGSIVVNYDGIAKHRSRIAEGVFVGCNSNLIAPIELERNSFVAAGSTISKSVPADALAVARARQKNVEGWSARRREAALAAESKAGKGPRKT
ncbi:MAG: bifunctional UDP-N-acetylglucosamine diphosphorylase/glucosamine-1-phosphate N-acetyltransferase GlmU [Deltaproteobacteria bacterium]|nr:bifunctional UDP-N-acetylglucosamine diphosphorylase/glucosamine-1-phosphate N-acetyltransferase GlmU [Deltaproteobacteria bacterium]